MQARFAPIIVLTPSQMLAQYHLSDDECMELLRRLAPYERKLTTGGPCYRTADIERELEELRAGR
jgi:hypothetical protein